MVDSRRLGQWGTSYAGGHGIVLGATDRRLRCVAAQAPTISGYEQGLRRILPEIATDIENAFLAGRGLGKISELTGPRRHMPEETYQELLHIERLAAVGRMVSTISHDLRHPLSVILAYAESLLENGADQQHRKDLYEEIRLAGTQMTEQLNSLLTLSQGRDMLRATQGDVSEILRTVMQNVQARPEFHDIAFTLSNDGRCKGWFDRLKLERVFLNLLLNACEAVPNDSGKIEVSIQTTATGLQIRIADNGSGIPSEIRDRLFQPFVSHGKQNGFGLGLAVVQKIVEDHGGEIVVDRSGPEGTVFLLKLPSKPNAFASSRR